MLNFILKVFEGLCFPSFAECGVLYGNVFCTEDYDCEDVLWGFELVGIGVGFKGGG